MEDPRVWGEGASTRIVIAIRSHHNSKIWNQTCPRRRSAKGRLTIGCFRRSIAKEALNRSTPSLIYFLQKSKLLNQLMWRAKTTKARSSSWLSRMLLIRHLWATALRKGTNRPYFNLKMVTKTPRKKLRSREKLYAFRRAHRRSLNLSECLRSRPRNHP